MKFSQSLFPYTLKLFYCLNLGVSHIVINLEKKCVKLLENHKFEAIFFIKLNLSSDWQYEAQNMSCHFSLLKEKCLYVTDLGFATQFTYICAY